jgi:hypothetical protein
MRLSILNYGFDLGSEVPKYAVKEDDDLLKLAEGIVTKQSFGRGALIISEVMHTGLTNFNNRKYMEKGMDNSVVSFYHPHPTPFLMHHDSGGDFGPPVVAVGTNITASFIKRRVETATGSASGYVKVATFVPEAAVVGGQNAIELLKSRRLFSLSIGARVADENYICSICGKSLYDSECDHISGRLYDGKKCEAHVYNPLFREYSAVYNPSDINALVRRMDVLEGENTDEDKILVVDSYIPSGYAHIYENLGKSVHSLGGIGTNEKAGNVMGDNLKDPSMTDSEVNDLLNKYVKMLGDKDTLNTTIAKQLSEALDTIDSLKSEINSMTAELNDLKSKNEEIEGKLKEAEDKLAKKDEETEKGDEKKTEKDSGSAVTETDEKPAETVTEPKKEEGSSPQPDPSKTEKQTTNIADIIDKAISGHGLAKI